MGKKTKKTGAINNIVPDFELWARVSKTVVPTKPEFAKELEKYILSDIQQANKPVTGQTVITRLKSGVSNISNTSGNYQLTGLDRRQQQQLLRGKVQIDARIDLHGESLETARLKLWRFICVSSDQGCRTVLVITGKGSSDFTRHTLHGRDYHDNPGRSGRLRNALPDWLHEPEFRNLVSGFQPAHPKHGGGGAAYVKLRNQNKRNR